MIKENRDLARGLITIAVMYFLTPTIIITAVRGKEGFESCKLIFLSCLKGAGIGILIVLCFAIIYKLTGVYGKNSEVH